MAVKLWYFMHFNCGGGDEWQALAQLTAKDILNTCNYSNKTLTYARKQLALRGLAFADERESLPAHGTGLDI